MLAYIPSVIRFPGGFGRPHIAASVPAGTGAAGGITGTAGYSTATIASYPDGPLWSAAVVNQATYDALNTGAAQPITWRGVLIAAAILTIFLMRDK